MNTAETAEIRAEINESLQLGVPMDTILANLQDRGIDVFDFHQQEIKKENEEKSEIELTEDALQKAKKKLTWVKVLFVLALILMLASLSSNSLPVPFLITFGVIIGTWFSHSNKIKELEAHLEFLNSNEEDDGAEKRE